MITFVTGIYGAGKTTTAKALGGRYVDYDESHDYQAGDHDPMPLLLSLQPGDVVDAIPFRPPAPGRHKWDRFVEWAAGRETRVIVAVCSQKQWRKRVGTRADDQQWCWFWVEAFGLLAASTEWVSTEGGTAKPITREQAAELVGLKAALKDYVTKHAVKWHDAKYQDVSVIGLTGYSESRRSWDVISRLVHWKGKTVVDAGCNHAYFALEAWKAGAKEVHGLDMHAIAVAVGACAAFLEGAGSVSVRRWAAGEPVPAADVLLCLNAIHHFGDKADEFMATAPAPVAIYEAGTEWADRLRAHYVKVKAHPSHRSGRSVFLCER